MRSSQPPFVTRAVQRVTDARWRVLLVAAVVVASIGSGARLLTMNADYKVFFSRENPQLAAFDALQNTYTKDDNILVAIEPADGDVFSRATLGALERWLPRAGACHMPLASTPSRTSWAMSIPIVYHHQTNQTRQGILHADIDIISVFPHI